MNLRICRNSSWLAIPNALYYPKRAVLSAVHFYCFYNDDIRWLWSTLTLQHGGYLHMFSCADCCGVRVNHSSVACGNRQSKIPGMEFFRWIIPTYEQMGSMALGIVQCASRLTCRREHRSGKNFSVSMCWMVVGLAKINFK